ncbi:MAG: hypothetical protein AAFV95_29055, partial [Bacteroidota bacterium]
MITSQLRSNLNTYFQKFPQNKERFALIFGHFPETQLTENENITTLFCHLQNKLGPGKETGSLPVSVQNN